MNEIEILEEKLKYTYQAYQMAGMMSRFKAGFLGRSAHELRSPVSKLTSLHQIILYDLCESPEEEREFISEAYQAARKLIQLLDEVILVSKVDYGGIKMELIPKKLSSIFNTIYSLTYLQANNYNIKLEISSPNPDIYVMVDEKRFQQVLLNLIDTAITYTKKGKISLGYDPSIVDGLLKINLDLPCHYSIWSETVDLLEQLPLSDISHDQIKSFSQQIDFSPGMKLMLSQTLLEAMGGTLVVEDQNLQSSVDNSEITRLQCLIPVVEGKNSFPELAED